MAEIEKHAGEPEPDLRCGFAMTGLGPLPKGWRVVRLEHLVEDSFSGGTPSTSVNEYWGGDIPWTTSAAINEDDVLLTRYQRTISRIGLLNSSCKVAPKGSLLVGTRVGVGKAVIATYDIAISQDLTALVLKKDVQGLFLAYLFKCALLRHQVEERIRGTTIKGIPRRDLLSLQIPLPPLAEQTAIAHVLRRIQRAKAATEQVIAATGELKKSLMRYLFTYGPVPVEEAERVPLKETEIGAIPKDWRVVRLGDVIAFERGVSWSKADEARSGTGVLSIPNIREDGRLDLTPRVRITKYIPPGKVLRLGDVLLVGSSGSIQNVGRAGVVSESAGEPLTFASFTVRANARDSRLEQDFVAFLLRSPWVDFSTLVKRAADGKYNLQVQLLRNHKVPLPPLSEQRSITRILQAVDKKLKAEEARKGALEALFKALLHHLMTGNVRVNHVFWPETREVIGMTQWLWTWSGRCFGYRDGNDLWTYDGKHVGRFVADEVYAPDGRYLGEVMNGRLITNLGKKHYRSSPFTPCARRGSYAKYADYAGYAMPAGYEDFPKLEREA